MSCKFPVESRSHKACVLCSDKDLCSDSTVKNDDVTLLSASEAHKNTVNNIKNCSTKQLAEISKRISDTIANGKFSISGDGCLQYETIQRLEELGISQANCYLYMQGHSVFNLVSRIGKALLDESFEYQVLIPSFSIDNDYQELNSIKKDIAKVFVQSN